MTNPARILGLALTIVTLHACGDGSTTETDPISGAAYRNAGPYTAGVTTVALADREVEIWYPVDAGDEDGRPRDAYFIRDWLPDFIDALLPADANPPFETNAYRAAPASGDGPFPLVLFAHGSASFRTQSTFLTTHLATWGFVVVAPDYLERGLGNALGQPPEQPFDDLELSRAAVDLAKAENARTGGLLEGKIATARMAITGHSAGGGSSFRFGGEPGVVTYIPLSAGSRSDSADFPNTPSMWLTGDIDGIVSVDGVITAFENAPPSSRLVIVQGGGHLAPTDLCRIGADGGGIVKIGLDAGLPVPEGLQRLGTDGCQDDALPAEDGWPVFKHFVTAQLRWAFGIDAAPIGLSADVAADFPEAQFTYRER